MNKVIAPVLASVAALGIVGGVAAAQAFNPADKPQQVRLVQPAAETVTPSPTTTTVAPKPKPAPVKSVKVAVSSTTKATTTSAPQTVQRQAIVSETPTDPTPVETQPQPAPATPGGPPPVRWGSDGKPPAPPTEAK